MKYKKIIKQSAVVLICSMVPVGIYFDVKRIQKLKNKYTFEVYESDGSHVGYTNEVRKNGCVNTTQAIVCGSFLLKKIKD